jgi:low-affinity inorganic phosphate transporter
MFGLESSILILFILCLVAIFFFEFINGFHDTANAVATVIYTNTLKPQYAVILSGSLNFLGVMLGGVGVAMSIVDLLPMEAFVGVDIGLSVSVIFAVLISAIIWNLGTWYFGIPCSSSHTLVGSIIGAVMAFSIDLAGNINNVPWAKAKDIGFSLLISPFVGFCLAFLMVLLLKKRYKKTRLFEKPDPQNPPPFWIRLILILTCSGVSYAHGSNDGQKGVGLTLLALICFVPGYFAINQDQDLSQIMPIVQPIKIELQKVNPNKLQEGAIEQYFTANHAASEIINIFQKDSAVKSAKDRFQLRIHLAKLDKSMKKMFETYPATFTSDQTKLFKEDIKELKPFYEYAPKWVILMISLALGIGTMIGWKRIVVTIGQKIGKEHLTYAQGASSELIAASTIGLSTLMKLPVSTTHILSSGIAGTMVASKGMKNLQRKTIQNIALAWVLTLPVCIFLGFSLFYLFKLIIA